MMLVLNTCPDRKAAERIAESLVKKKLAACVSILPISKSFYRWKGKTIEAGEWLLLIKTKAALYNRAEAHIKANHPHKVPEIIGLRIGKCEKNYFDWVEESTA
jgi:periplasmic divalent cation tolerance protein